MRSKRRVLAATALLLGCAPGNIVHEHVSWDPPKRVAIEQIAGESGTSADGWDVAGVWALSGDGLLFGGFSALVALPNNRLMAFSDRGARFVFDEPNGEGAQSVVARQVLAEDRTPAMPDIESAAYDPRTGDYWIGFENNHSIDRFARDHTPLGVRDMNSAARTLDWSNNSGAEAFTRLADGRFALLPEGKRTGLIFPEDPTKDADFDLFAYLPPVPGHGATDMVQLPDGRVLLLLRNLDPLGGLPPFESKIAIGPAPQAGPSDVWKPQVTLDLAGVVPRENYEGIAVRPMKDGRIALWLISDDNKSVLQRTLVVKLVINPKKLESKADKAKGARR